MKNLLIFLFCAISFFSFIFAQTDPEEFLKKLPPLPEDPCLMTKGHKNEYLDQISILHKEIIKEISNRKQQGKVNAKTEEEEMKKKLAKQYGLSESDMEKMKGNKMNEAEKKALAEKLMKSGTNMPVDQKKNMDSYELAQEQKLLTEKIGKQDAEFLNRIEEQNNLDSAATRDHQLAVDPLLKELLSINDGEGGTEEDGIHRHNIQMKINEFEHKYCSRMTPSYLIILKERLAVITKSLPDYKRLEEVISQLNKNITGSKQNISEPGLMGLEKIEDYTYLLQTVFKYSSYSFVNE